MSDLFYLHEYTGGQEDVSHSCGFVKFSCQSGWMVSKNVSISINIKGAYSHNTAKENIYALVQTDGDYLGAVLLTNMYIENGFGKTECVVDAEDISGSGFIWEDVCGIAVVPNNFSTIAAVSWQDEDIDINNIKYGVTKSQIETADTDAVYSGESAGQELYDADITPKQYDENIDGALYAAGENVSAAEEPFQNAEGEADETHAQNNLNSSSEDRFDNNDKTVNKDDSDGRISVEEISIMPMQRTAATVQQIFDKIEGNPVDAFEDDYFYDCMEVTPKQLQQMIGIDVSQNSFLMHAYYTFRHILVAKVQDDPNALFVGIPGIYSNRERFMASMFNFNNFKRSHRSDCRNPHFGYWYQEI